MSSPPKFADLPRVHPAIYNCTSQSTRKNSVPRQRVECGHKGCTKAVTFSVNDNKPKPFKKFRACAEGRGWTFDDDRDRFICPDHSKTEDPMTKTKAAEPTISPKMRREIFRAIDESYDEKSQRYVDGVDDKSLAAQVGTTWGWVSRIREENFGPAGPDPKIAGILDEMSELAKKIAAVETESMALAEKAENYGKALVQLRSRVESLT